jgi:hypothetical protein
MIQKYFEKVRKRILQLKWLIERETLDIECDEDAGVGMMSGSLQFKDGSALHFKEIFLVSQREYRFHFMDRHHRLICRWDSAPHHRELKTFPHHMHTSAGVAESKAVTLIEILETVTAGIIESLDK